MDEPQKRLTHLDDRGRPRMVDVSNKGISVRRAVAEGSIRMARKTVEAIREGETSKGEVLQVARLAGIQAGKRTGELIPLCHLLPGTSLAVDVDLDPELPGIRVRATATLAGQTGVEMEALTATAVALLTVYDMVKSMDRGMVLERVQLVAKEGGRSGRWVREESGGRDQPPER
jgi:cyclic pyranopterin phosphate synthase